MSEQRLRNGELRRIIRKPWSPTFLTIEEMAETIMRLRRRVRELEAQVPRRRADTRPEG